MASAYLPQHDGLLPYFLLYVSSSPLLAKGDRGLLTNATLKAGASAMIHSFVTSTINMANSRVAI
jgi:hypothetical protein